MLFKRQLNTAFRATIPIAMGYLPLGIAFGAYSTTLGFPFYVAPLTALVVFAGSMEFLLLGLVTGGAGLIQIATSTFLINSRHILYAVSYPQHLLQNRFTRFYGPFALTDETYALINGGFKAKDQSELILAQLLSHIYWVAGSLVGAIAGSFIPEGFDGFNFSLTGLFVLLSYGAYKRSSYRVLTFLAVAVAVVPALLVPREYFLITAMVLFTVLITIASKRTS